MGDVLVEHDAVEDGGLLDLAPRDLLDARVALDVDGLERAVVVRDGADGLEGELAHEVGPAHDELGADGGLDEREHLLVVVDVDGDGDALDDLEGLLEGFVVGGDDDDGVDVALELGEGLCEDLTRWEGYGDGLGRSRGVGYSPRMITLVVPSPHSSSCVLLSSIMFFAAGCATSISRRMAFPSFVSLAITVSAGTINTVKKNTNRIPPIGSRIIFSMAFGPRHVLITSATVLTRFDKPISTGKFQKREYILLLR